MAKCHFILFFEFSIFTWEPQFMWIETVLQIRVPFFRDSFQIRHKTFPANWSTENWVSPVFSITIYRTLWKKARAYFLFLDFRDHKFSQKYNNLAYKNADFIEDQLSKLSFNVFRAISQRFCQKCFLIWDLGWGLLSSGAYFRVALFSREYGIWNC